MGKDQKRDLEEANARQGRRTHHQETGTGTARRPKRRKNERAKAIGRKEKGGRGERTETGTFPRTNRHRPEKDQKVRSARDSTKTKTGAAKEKNAQLNNAIDTIACLSLSVIFCHSQQFGIRFQMKK